MNQTDLKDREALARFDWLAGYLVRFYLAQGPFKRLRGAVLNGAFWLLGRYLVLRRWFGGVSGSKTLM